MPNPKQEPGDPQVLALLAILDSKIDAKFSEQKDLIIQQSETVITYNLQIIFLLMEIGKKLGVPKETLEKKN